MTSTENFIENLKKNIIIFVIIYLISVILIIIISAVVIIVFYLNTKNKNDNTLNIENELSSNINSNLEKTNLINVPNASNENTIIPKYPKILNKVTPSAPNIILTLKNNNNN